MLLWPARPAFIHALCARTAWISPRYFAISPRYLRNYKRYGRDTSAIRTLYVRACPRPLRPTRGNFFVSPLYVRDYTLYARDIHGPGCSQEISRTTPCNTFLGNFPPRGTTDWEISTRGAIKTHVEPGLKWEEYWSCLVLITKIYFIINTAGS